jgi:phage anti-repressor protein
MCRLGQFAESLRIAAYNFLENQDFVVFANFGENPSGGRPAKEYAQHEGLALAQGKLRWPWLLC